jgi:hypothetical protein
MTSIADRLCPAAARLIAVLGRTVTLRRRGQPTYDPQTGNVTASTTDVSVKGIVEADQVGDRAELVVGRQLRLTIAADDVGGAPDASDEILIDGTAFAIAAVATRHAGDRPVLFTLDLRR